MTEPVEPSEIKDQAPGSKWNADNADVWLCSEREQFDRLCAQPLPAAPEPIVVDPKRWTIANIDQWL